jgi:hypothetical protein
MNCTIASRPTGIMRRGCKIRISSSIQSAQLRISSGAGTRSVPPEFLPGKQRQTAAKYIFDRTVGSSIPQNCSNQRKSVLPAVCANGRFNVGSRGPGACPMIITLLTMGPPETGLDSMRGQRRQPSRRLTCRLSNSCRLGVIMWNSENGARTPRTPKALRAKLTSGYLFRDAFGVRCVLASFSTPENREERQNQTQDNAENNAGNDGKIERRMFALDTNVTWQSAQPFWRETAPHHQTHQRRDYANDHDELSQFAHD